MRLIDFLQIIAKIFYIGHFLICSIVSFCILRCSSSLPCVVAALEKFPIDGLASTASFSSLDLVNEHLGMTDNLIGCLFGYGVAMIVTLLSHHAGNKWLARQMSISVIITTLAALVACVIVVVELDGRIDSGAVQYVTQNGTPLLLVLIGSLFFVFDNVENSPRIQSAMLSKRDVVSIFVAKFFLTIVSLAEIILIIVMFLSPYHSVVRSVSPEHHEHLITLSTSVGIARQLYAATVLAGLVSLQLTCVLTPIDRRQGMQWLLVPSVSCHLAWLLSWTLLVASAARQRSTNLPDSALAVADTFLILGLLATLIIGASFIVFVRVARKYSFAVDDAVVVLVERGVGNDSNVIEAKERKNNSTDNDDDDNNDEEEFVDGENDSSSSSSSSSFEAIPSTKRVVDATISRIDFSDAGGDDNSEILQPIPSF